MFTTCNPVVSLDTWNGILKLCDTTNNRVELTGTDDSKPTCISQLKTLQANTLVTIQGIVTHIRLHKQYRKMCLEDANGLNTQSCCRIEVVIQNVDERVNLGQLVKVTGWLDCTIPTQCEYGMAFYANNIQVLDREVAITRQMHVLHNIDDNAIANSQNTLQLLANWLAPGLRGLNKVKEALILQLASGITVQHGLRPQIHILLIGGTATGKSELARQLTKIDRVVCHEASKQAYRSLFSSVRKQTRQYLEAGSIQIVGKGVLCIDDLDLLDNATIRKLTIAMRKQKCSIFATTKNVPKGLACNFDLRFAVEEQCNGQIVKALVDRYNNVSDEQSQFTINRYMQNTRKVNTVIGMDICQYANERCVHIAKIQTVLRLACAHARLKLRKRVTESDVDIILRLIDGKRNHK